MFTGNSDTQTSIGPIAGGVVGGILAAVIVTVIVVFKVRRRHSSSGKLCLHHLKSVYNTQRTIISVLSYS